MFDAMNIALIKKLGGGTGGTGSGSGADLLNENGIIKQEVLPEGYPYAEGGYLLPETTVEIDPDMGMGILPDVVNATVGSTYTVNWNGTEYECTCIEMPAEDGTMIPVIGNAGGLMGEEGTGEPFAIMMLTAEMAGVMGGGVVATPLDGSTSVTFSIFGESITKMDAKFLPSNDFVVTYTKEDETASGSSYVVVGNHTLEEIFAAIEAGKNVKAVVSIAAGNLTIRSYLNLTEVIPGVGVSFTSCSLSSVSITINQITVDENRALCESKTIDGV